jgi:hypothetical protein
MPPRGIRTRIPSKQAATELRLRPRGHWDRLVITMLAINPNTEFVETERVYTDYYSVV